MLVGTYDCKADTKGRVMLPSSLREQFEKINAESFTIKRAVFQPCLELYPMREWELLMDKMNKLNRFIKRNNDFIRRFMAGVRVVNIDIAGRILMPKNLLEFAGIQKQVVLSSAINVVEIWNKDDYEKVIDHTAEDFSDLAENVMGDFKRDDVS